MPNPLFLEKTRQNWIHMPKKAITLGSTMQIGPLTKTGYLGTLYLMVKGTMTIIDGDANTTLKDVHDGKPFGMIKELRMLVNGTTIHRIPGYQLWLHNLLSQRSQFLDQAGAAAPGGYALSRPYAYAAAGAVAPGTANPWRFMVALPLSLNKLDLEGLLLLQTPDTEVIIEIDWAKDTDLFTIGAGDSVTWAGDLYTLMEVYSVPTGGRQFQPDGYNGKPGFLRSLLYQEKAISQVGDFSYALDRNNVYLRVFNRVILNGVRAALTDITQLSLEMNGGTQTPYREVDADMFQAIQRERYGRDLPQAVFVWDWHYQGTPSYATPRDWISAFKFTEFAESITIAAGAVLGANNNRLEVVREILQPLPQ